MNGSMYITSTGYDPDEGRPVKDPQFGKISTLGACRPDIRKKISPGDYIFVVSGKIPDYNQYIMGGFQVKKKIHATEAYRKFPHMRLSMKDGEVRGNIIVDRNGDQHPLDHHSPDSFERRIENYVVGGKPFVLETDSEIQLGRSETVPFMQELFERIEFKPIHIMGRHRKLKKEQVREVLSFLKSIKRRASK